LRRTGAEDVQDVAGRVLQHGVGEARDAHVAAGAGKRSPTAPEYCVRQVPPC
jgi:hypothetical protein